MHRLIVALGWMAAAGPAMGEATKAERLASMDYARDIRPLLADRCLGCHGGVHREGDLSLLFRQDATRAGESGRPAIVPCRPEESELIRRVTARDRDQRMPPRGRRLSDNDVERLRAWIADGAPFPTHWAYLPPRSRPLPEVNDASWPKGGIDRWVLAKIEREGLRPSPPAERHALIRRAFLDLTGLPPTPEEVRAFVEDSDPLAYEKVVDRLLASPAYGERWARVWLDLARYADTQGYEKDSRRTIWRYRDWVIDAFNRDLPYDRFTIEQLAGDLLPEPTTEQLIATAFHRNTMTNTEGGTDDEEFRMAAVMDRVSTTWQVWMGTSFGCAQCHDHPYDPFRQREYYSFLAFFNNTEDNDQPDERPTIPTPTRAEISRRARLAAELDALSYLGDPAPRAPGLAGNDALANEVVELRERLESIQTPTTPVLRELPEGRRRLTHVLERGSFLAPGEVVREGVPSSMPPHDDGEPRDRLTLARWIVDEANPLTARVAVNRFWGELFGTGLVETSEDFGTQGSPPSHPALLDWLAVRFVHQHGWSVKGLLREIVLSATYRQSSRATPALLERDPGNRLLARAPRFRLAAETVRDQALAVSGLLSRKMYGPSVMPPQPPGIWQVVYSGDRWRTSEGEDRYRRGLYTFWRRTSPHPSMVTFDAPSREICTVRRIRTNTPLQALVTLNDPAFFESAQALARRIVEEGGATVGEMASSGWRLALCRPPRPDELERIVSLHDEELERLRREDERVARDLAEKPLGPAPPDLDVRELAAWTIVANVILNLDEFLTRQ